MKPEDIQCPVCGYYCLGKGGIGCIDKPFYVENDLDMGDFDWGIKVAGTLTLIAATSIVTGKQK